MEASVDLSKIAKEVQDEEAAESAKAKTLDEKFGDEAEPAEPEAAKPVCVL